MACGGLVRRKNLEVLRTTAADRRSFASVRVGDARGFGRHCLFQMPDLPPVTVVGAGPTGALVALLLAKRGYSIQVYEYRDDPRQKKASTKKASDFADLGSTALAKVADAAKRSINLTLSHRGLSGLKRAGIDTKALELAVPVRGRMIHGKDGSITLQPYDPDPNKVMHSVGRESINGWLLEQLAEYEASGTVKLHFGYKCVRVKADGSADFEKISDKSVHSSGPGKLLGCDGTFSKVRAEMARISRLSVSIEYIEHGYKELAIKSKPCEGDKCTAGGKGATHAMPAEGLHIWPGSETNQTMLIALPNADGSFTCTLFGEFAFLESLKTEEAVRAFFASTWPDSLELMPDLPAQYLRNPNAALSTVRCSPWHLNGNLLLLGDAAHGVVPFYGQGMNCAFEDCLLLDDALTEHKDVWDKTLPSFSVSRKRATDALAKLAIDNYEEMRDKTVDNLFLLKCKLHEALHSVLGETWQPSLHSAVTFTSMPYDKARSTFEWQDAMLVRAGVAVGGLLAVGVAVALARAVRK